MSVDLSRQVDPATITADDRDTLRTYWAADRTLLSWTRTSLSLISFGFTMYKFLQYMAEAGEAPRLNPAREPRHVAMAMIALGVIFLIAACVQYWANVRQFRAMHLRVWRLSLYLAVLLALLGVAAMLNVTFRMEI